MPDADFSFNEVPPETDEEAVDRLAKLPPLEYDRLREAEARRLGVRVATLDLLVKKTRGGGEGAANLQGSALKLDPPEPWPEEVDGATLLDELTSFFRRHVYLPRGAPEAMAVWAVLTYCFSRFTHTPRLALTSPEPRCGKTTALDTLALVVCKPLSCANVTAPVLFRVIELTAPTLLIDEADTFVKDSEEIRGVLNAGHKQGGQVLRCVGDDAEPRAFGVFGPAAIAAIGRLPGTIEDRSFMIRMKRATAIERPEPLDGRAIAEASRLARKAARWTADHTTLLGNADPVLPSSLFNREADKWRPCFAIASIAGGDWPSRLEAAVALLASDETDAESLGVKLLADIREVFEVCGVDRLPSADLCEALVKMETSPWAESNHGKPLSALQLARKLKPFNIKPGSKRSGKDTFKGYLRSDFEEAWARYLPAHAAAGGPEPSHRHNGAKTNAYDGNHPSHETSHGVDEPSHRHNGADEERAEAYAEGEI